MVHWNYCTHSQKAAAPGAQVKPGSVLRGRSCSTCSSGTTVFSPRKLLLLVLQRSRRLCSKIGAAPHAPLELLYLLPGSSCSKCCSRATVSAPREELLQRGAAPHAPLEPLYSFPESCCSRCSSRATVCAPRKDLLHLLQWTTVFVLRKQLLQVLHQTQRNQHVSCVLSKLGIGTSLIRWVL